MRSSLLSWTALHNMTHFNNDRLFYVTRWKQRYNMITGAYLKKKTSHINLPFSLCSHRVHGFTFTWICRISRIVEFVVSQANKNMCLLRFMSPQIWLFLQMVMVSEYSKQDCEFGYCIVMFSMLDTTLNVP